MTAPLISTAWLAERLNDDDLRIVDIRGHVLPASEPPPHYFNHRADYDEAHLPGAVFVDWVHEITDPADPRHAQIAKPERFSAVMSRLGIGPKTYVVAYDDAGGMFAARLWWALNYYGHTRVSVLDGGWPRWNAERRPVSADVPEVAPAEFVARPNPAIYRDADEVARALGGSASVMDVRTPEEFRGEASRAQRAGHIPGAINVPRSTLLNPDGTMLAQGQLYTRFIDAGIRNGQPVITYCNGGVSASYGMLALRVAGFRDVAVYDGSWKEWGNDEQRPIARED